MNSQLDPPLRQLVELFRGLKMGEIDSHSSHTTLRALESPPSTLSTDNAPSSASKDFSSRTISSTQSEELTYPSTTNPHLPNELVIQILHHALHLRGSSVPPPIDFRAMYPATVAWLGIWLYPSHSIPSF